MSTSSATPSSSTSSTGSSGSSGSSGSAGSVTPARTGGSALESSQGRTTIADSVVQKIAGRAARDVQGVYAMGAGAARAFGALRERIPGGGSSGPNVTQGVAVEVGERQAAVDIDVVVEYGVRIADLATSIRQNVVDAVETMTGLQVTEVNISVDDVHLPGDDSSSNSGSRQESAPEPSRVQ